MNVTARCSGNVRDDDAVLDVELLLLIITQVGQHQAHAVGLGLVLVRSRASSGARGRLFFLQFHHAHGEVLGGALAPHLQRYLGSGSDLGNDPWQFGGRIHGSSIDFDDDVAGLDPGLVRRAAFFHRIHERPALLG